MTNLSNRVRIWDLFQHGIIPLWLVVSYYPSHFVYLFSFWKKITSCLLLTKNIKKSYFNSQKYFTEYHWIAIFQFQYQKKKILLNVIINFCNLTFGPISFFFSIKWDISTYSSLSIIKFYLLKLTFTWFT